jgi:hypothetical protein
MMMSSMRDVLGVDEQESDEEDVGLFPSCTTSSVTAPAAF